MKRYVTRRVEIDAVQWTGENRDEIAEICGDDTLHWYSSTNILHVRSINHDMYTHMELGGWLIRDADGRLSTCGYSEFGKRYEEL